MQTKEKGDSKMELERFRRSEKWKADLLCELALLCANCSEAKSVVFEVEYCL